MKHSQATKKKKIRWIYNGCIWTGWSDFHQNLVWFVTVPNISSRESSDLSSSWQFMPSIHILSDTLSHLKTMCHNFAKTGDLAGLLFARLQLDSFWDYFPSCSWWNLQEEKLLNNGETETEAALVCASVCSEKPAKRKC